MRGAGFLKSEVVWGDELKIFRKSEIKSFSSIADS